MAFRQEYSDLFAPDIEAKFQNMVNGIVNKFTIAKKQIQQRAAEMMGEVSNMKTIDSKAITDINKMSKELENLKRKTFEVTEAEKQYKTLSQSLAKEKAKQTQENIKLARSLQQQRDATRQLIKDQGLIKGSYQQINTQLNKNIAKYHQLDAVQRQSQGGKLLLNNIKAQTNELKAIDAQMGRHQRNVGNYVSGLRNFGALLGITFSVQILRNFFQTAMKGYDSQQKSEALLLTALKGRVNIQQSLLKQANELQKRTLYEDDEIINAQSLIASFVKEENQIKTLIPLTQDLATAKGIDLASAADLVAKTLGSSTNALKRQGIEVKGAVGSAARYTSLVNGLSKAFEGQAEAAAKAGAGPMQLLKLQYKEHMEILGGKLVPIMNRFATSIIAIIAPTKKRIDLYSLDNKEMNLNFKILKDGNLTQEARKKVIGEINDQYGSYLPNLLTEKSTLQEIEAAQKAVNDQLRITIISKSLNEELTKIFDEERKAVEGLTQAEINNARKKEENLSVNENTTKSEIKLQEDLGEMVVNLNKNIIDSTEEKEKSTREKYKKIAEFYGIAFSEIEKALLGMNRVTKLSIEGEIGLLNKLNKQLSDLQEQRNKALSADEIYNIDIRIEKTKELIESYNIYARLLEDIKNQTKELTSEIDAMYDSIDQDVNDKNKAFLDEFKNKLKGYSDEFNKQNELEIQYREETGHLKKSLYEQELKDLESVYKSGAITEEEYQAQRFKMWQSYNEKIIEAIMSLKESMINASLSYTALLSQQAQEDISVHDKKIDELKDRLDIEKELQEQGAANSVDIVQGQLNEELAARKRAQKEYAKIQKLQARIELAAQAANLITATTILFKEGAKEGGIYGVVIALGAIASMMAYYMSYKAKINAINAESEEQKYAKGTIYVKGKGTGKSDSIPARLSKGERVIPSDINSQFDGISNTDLLSIYKMNNLKLYTDRERSDNFLTVFKEGTEAIKDLVYYHRNEDERLVYVTKNGDFIFKKGNSFTERSHL